MVQPFSACLLTLTLLAGPAQLSVQAQTASVAAPAEKPAINGTWKFDPAKSEYSPAPLPSSQTESLSISGDSITIAFDSVADDGKQKYTYTLPLNGPELPFPKTGVVNETPLSVLSAKAEWKDGILVITQKVTYEGGPGSIRSVYTLSPDGKTLVKTLSVSIEQGNFELKAIFERA